MTASLCSSDIDALFDLTPWCPGSAQGWEADPGEQLVSGDAGALSGGFC